MKLKTIIFLFWLLAVICGLIGCDAFVRKFTRKSKKENLPQEELVLAPEEYKGPKMDREDLYRQYFLFWNSWHDEFVASLSSDSNRKKQIECAEEAIKNLINLKPLLNEEKQKELDVYINRIKTLRDRISKDLYGGSVTANVQSAERIKRDILRDFSYRKIKDYLI